MQLGRFPRRRYLWGPTPLEPMANLSAALGGPEIWIKRDDLASGLAGGGNKARKLEFLVADALEQGCDTLITIGAMQSNHCRLTLAAAAREGLACRLLLQRQGHEPYDSSSIGNRLLYDLMGAEEIALLAPNADPAAALAEAAAQCSAQGRRPYAIPVGGSNPRGALGYVVCARELAEQCFERGLAFDALIAVSGSAGTHAGLMVGAASAAFDVPIVGVSVARLAAAQRPLVAGLAEATAQMLALAPPPAPVVRDEWLGEGYARPGPDAIEAVRLLARLEGVLLDPVYTGKAMAGLIGMIRAGEVRRGQRVLFLHSGGSPALHAFAPLLRS